MPVLQPSELPSQARSRENGACMKPSSPKSIRGQYEARGVAPFYQAVREGRRAYRNPHEPQIHRALRMAVERWQPDLSRVLDLAAGTGEATRGILLLRESGHKIGVIEGADPYTAAAYTRRTERPAETWSFEQIAAGVLAGRKYSLIVCSYALHLLEGSRLPVVAQQLAVASSALLVLTPNRRPEIKAEWGWEECGRFAVDAVKTRFYRSIVE